jgi:hypothetical protein
MGRITSWLGLNGAPAAAAAMAGTAATFGSALAGRNKKNSDSGDKNANRDSDSGGVKNGDGKAESSGGKNGGGEARAENSRSQDGGRDRDGGRNRDNDDGGDGGERLSRQERLRQSSQDEQQSYQRSRGSEVEEDASGGDYTSDTYSTSTRVSMPQQAPNGVVVSPPGTTSGNASIVTPEGGVLVGYDPATGSMVASSGNVTAISGPGGPMVIISDESVVQIDPGTSPGSPLPAPDQIPSPPAPAPPPPPSDGGRPDDDTGFAS